MRCIAPIAAVTPSVQTVVGARPRPPSAERRDHGTGPTDRSVEQVGRVRVVEPQAHDRRALGHVRSRPGHGHDLVARRERLRDDLAPGPPGRPQHDEPHGRSLVSECSPT
ncbi:hypothetical protein GCM10023203_23820 [Actinomycetospora straminea]|uniref:Uncharacterized protein n=1 Tax=Actinomycetospora straminea TaxID=663607 RepID=A0ABP9ED32_9PSEU